MSVGWTFLILLAYIIFFFSPLNKKYSLQRRVNPQELDNEALAFKPVMGSMLARIYHNPHNKEENQSRLQKIVQFWASKEVYDQDTISGIENDMISGLPPNSFPGPQADASGPGDHPGTLPTFSLCGELPIRIKYLIYQCCRFIACITNLETYYTFINQ